MELDSEETGIWIREGVDKVYYKSYPNHWKSTFRTMATG